MIAEWLSPGDVSLRTLSKLNDVEMVRCFAYSGPHYTLRVDSSSLRRGSAQIYYDNEWASLLLALIVKHGCKPQPIFDDLVRHWVAQGSPCALLAPKRDDIQTALLQDVLAMPEACALRLKLVRRAAEAGEWEVIQHDATFKCLFSLIGQVNMAQKEGELHAAHTILGKTGALAGVSPQAKEGREQFKQACTELLPTDARATTKYIFSDDPSKVAGCADIFPALEGVAEDAMHLVFRTLGCFGEQQNCVSALVKVLQLKFRIPTQGVLYQGDAVYPASR